MNSLVPQARGMAQAFLAEALPRRWAHTIGVAEAAARLARALAPDHADTIVAAAWLHDIGYAPALAKTGFHPIDGACHVAQTAPSLCMAVNLIAHHSGGVFEAQQRGLQSALGQYRFPVDVVQLAILNCADLSTSPDAAFIDPTDRLAEVLDRYPPQHPVHRAVAKSRPLLIAQARLVLGAAEAAGYSEPRVELPEQVECRDPGGRWEAVWSSDYHRITAIAPALGHTGPGTVEISLTNPPDRWHPADPAGLADDLHAATLAAQGAQLGWNQYHAFPVIQTAGWPHRAIDECLPTPRGSATTFHFDDIIESHLDMAARGQSIQLQQRRFTTLSGVSQWADIPIDIVDAPLDLRARTDAPNPLRAAPHTDSPQRAH